MISLLSRAAWPLAGAWARGGYFHAPDLNTVEPANIALVACHWVGDTFWAAQVVEPLRRRFPQAMISAITKPHAADLWNGLIYPRQLILAPQMISDRRRERVNWHSMAALARELRARQFDLVIDLMGNRYSAAFTFLLRPRLGIGFDGQELGWLYSLRVQAELPGDHLSRRPLRVIQPLIQRAGSVSDGTNQRVLPSPPFPTVDPRELLAELGLSDKRYQVVAPFAGWSAKEWPSNNFARLAAALKDRGFAVVIVGTVAQQARCTELASAMASPQAGGIAEDPTVPRVIVFAGRPLGELVALLSHAGGAAANDSAVAHIAAAFGLPTAAIFTANTNPQNAAPLGPKARVFPQDCSIDEVTAHLTGE